MEPITARKQTGHNKIHPIFFLGPIRESSFAIVLGIWNKTKYDFHIKGLFELAISLLPYLEQGNFVHETFMNEIK